MHRAIAGFFFWALGSDIVERPGLYKQLTEPPCSYVSTQNRKGLIRGDDRVLAWIRAVHNGGAIPLRHFLAVPRVINDTYGLFFYDADGDYVTAYQKDYGYQFHGWRRGVMMVKGRDGTLWSALSGVAFDGPQKGKRLTRIPNFMTQWGHWLMLHPESTAYDLFDGNKYPVSELPKQMNAEARSGMGNVDARLPAMQAVMGVEANGIAKAFPLDLKLERAAWMDSVGGEEVAVLWYGPTRSAVAFKTRLGDRKITLYADDGSPESAPFKDKETGTRWTLAGRAVDGKLRGQELAWAPSVQCRWYAWAADYPGTQVYAKAR